MLGFVSTFCAGRESARRPILLAADGGSILLGATREEQVVVRLPEALGGSITLRAHAQNEVEMGLPSLQETLRRAGKIS